MPMKPGPHLQNRKTAEKKFAPRQKNCRLQYINRIPQTKDKEPETDNSVAKTQIRLSVEIGSIIQRKEDDRCSEP